MFEIINHKLFEMKKSLIVLLTLFSCVLSAQSVFFLHGVKISNKDSKAFESIEMEYMSKLAQDEVNAGRMRGWALLKRVPGIGDASDLPSSPPCQRLAHGYQAVPQGKHVWTPGGGFKSVN